MTWFRSFRADHGFTFYGDQPSPESLDKPLVAVVYACVLLSGATLIATLGIRGREKWSHAVRASYAVAIASSILLCLMSHNWMEGRIEVKAPFVYRSNMHFSGSLSVQIGLKSANITLDGTYMGPAGGRVVYFVETLPWPKYGLERQCYQHQLQRGLPAPILRVMDFLTYEHGDLQWGKSYHMAGQYAWALLWTSFVFWLLSNLLLFSVVIYGAYMFFLSGVSMLMACVAFSQTLNPQPLHMTFGPDVLKLEYGWSFWLAIVAGCLTTILGVLLIVTDHFLHSKVAEFFHLEKMVEEEELSSKDDSSIPFNKQRFYTDARGSLASTTNGDNSSRRGSIFLDPSRQTKWTTMNPLLGLGGSAKGNPFGSQHGLANGNGLGPDAKEMTRYDATTPFRLNLRSKSESFISANGKPHRSLFNSNDRKPSLATLKEHRENHVNEQRFNSSQSCSSSQSPGGASSDSNLPSSVTRSLNDVNVNNNRNSMSSHHRESGRFIHEAAEKIIRQRSSSGLENGRLHNRASCRSGNSDNNSNGSETVVEVFVENHHRGCNSDRRGGGDEIGEEEGGGRGRGGAMEARVSPQGAGEETTMKSGATGDDIIELQRRQRNCDSSSSSSNADGSYSGRASRSSSSICSSPGADVVFALSYSRQASEGEEGDSVTPHDVIESDNDVAMTVLDRKTRKMSSADNDRQVSISIGEI